MSIYQQIGQAASTPIFSSVKKIQMAIKIDTQRMFHIQSMLGVIRSTKIPNWDG